MSKGWLATVATIASPETILRWYRELVAKKYDGSQQRGQGRPKTSAEVAALVVGRLNLGDGFRDSKGVGRVCHRRHGR